MLKTTKNKNLGLHKSIAFVVVVIAILFCCIVKVNAALIEHGTGSECFAFDMDENGFPYTSVTINGAVWDKNDDHRYYTNDNVYRIVIKAGKKGNQYPWISTAGGLDDYKTYTAVDNPENDENVDGDEFLLTLVLDNMPYEGQCAGLGISLQDGPFPVVPVIHAETEVSITISGDELEYHYVEDKPDEPDVTYFKFGINSGISEDIVPFTFGNANYTHNDNEPPKNVSSVTTKQPIHYEYDHDGSGFVTFYINGGATDEYTKIEINGVDYSDQAPHTQIEYFEHLIGRALIFEIHDVPYADTYNVVVEGRQTALENRVGSIGWSYLSSERSNLSGDEQEGNFAHGKLEFVAAKYTDIDGVTYEFNSVQEYNSTKFHGTGEIYAWYDGKKDYPEEDRRLAWGESQVPYGTELTLRIVPDSGYQLVGLAKSPTGFTATDEVGVYKVVLTAENFLYGDEYFDLQPVFAEVGSEVNATSTNVKNGNVDINTAFENGTAKLEVNDVISMSPERVESFENKATEEDYDIEYYLDIALYNTIYKGGKTDSNGNMESWDTPVENLDDKATITLELKDALEGKDLVLIHETHNGNEITGYEVIDVAYDSENNTITFESDSFSNYAIASRTVGENETPDEDEVFTVEFNSNCEIDMGSVNIHAGDKVEEPDVPENGDMEFVGWYEDEELENRYDFNTPVERNMVLYAKWVEADTRANYTVEDESGNEVQFREEAGHEYHLSITDYLAYSKEEIVAAVEEMTPELYDQVFGGIKEATKEYGEFIALYEIEVYDGDYYLSDGPFTVKIKMTDEMKEYNSFKLFFLNDDFTLGDSTEFTVEGDYIIGTLEDLNTYALVADVVTENPKTGDTIYLWIAMLIISIVGLVMGAVISRKFKKSKVR